MIRNWSFVRRYGFDALVVAVALEGALEVVIRQEDSNAPGSSVWFAAPAIALLALPLLARRRFPFAAPACLWVLAAVLSIIDGELVTFTASASIAGLAASFLLGNLRDATLSRVGLALTLGSSALLMYNDPDHSAADLVFTPHLLPVRRGILETMYVPLVQELTPEDAVALWSEHYADEPFVEVCSGELPTLRRVVHRNIVSIGFSSVADVERPMLIVVAGFPDEEWRQEATRRGLRNVTFLGRVPYDQIGFLLALADVAVSPKLSTTEGNLKLYSYMAAGLPVVVFDNTTNREILGDAGTFVEPANGLAFTAEIARLLAAPARREELPLKRRQ